MAVEDALELANELGMAAGPPVVEPVAATSTDPTAVGRMEAALRRYEASRAPRTSRVTEQSRQVGAVGQGGD